MVLEAVQFDFDPARARKEIVLVSSGPEYTPWLVERTNHAPNPYAAAGGANASGYSGTSGFQVGVFAVGRTWYQAACTTVAQGIFAVSRQIVPAVEGDTVYASGRVRNPNAEPLDFALTLRGRTVPDSPTGGSQTSILHSTIVTIPPNGEHVFDFSWVVTGATTRGAALTASRNAGGAAAIDDLIQVTDWYLSREPGTVFAGSDLDTTTEQYSWAGEENNSSSILETREERPGVNIDGPLIKFFPYDSNRVRQEVVVVPYDPEYPLPIYRELL